MSWRQPRRIGGVEIDDKAHDGLVGEVATANTESPNFDQAGQGRRRPDNELARAHPKMDAVIADQHGRRYLPGAAGQNEIECQARFAGSRRPQQDEKLPVAGFDVHAVDGIPVAAAEALAQRACRNDCH